jgi:hypothetical protein
MWGRIGEDLSGGMGDVYRAQGQQSSIGLSP